ncbi:MAG: NnrS family protein [Myxococcales bacterium]|nr:NnrS family protein [Myxococcales bacterium]MCB9524144.1 NnrS family protein [Myxococcales bacterium]
MSNRLPLLGEPTPQSAVARAPTWLAMGFRPFFFSASLFAVISVGLWLHALTTGRDPASGVLPPTLWHAHELTIGYGLGVVAGFLLTAARNWTGRDTLHGRSLLALWLVWLAGRALMVGPGAPPLLIGGVQVLFPLGLTLAVGRVIIVARSRRNYGLVALLAGLTVAVAAVHAAPLGVDPRWPRVGLYGAVHGLVLINVVVAGRIVPLFTRNRTGAEVTKVPAVEHLALGLATALIPLGAVASVSPDPLVQRSFGLVAVASGGTQLLRMRTWGTRAALGVPLLAVLHAGAIWIGLGHLLLGAVALGLAYPPTVAIHALTLGVIGTLTVGMMTRVSMGHTGRPIRDRPLSTAAFVAVNLATALRLAGPLLPPAALVGTWHASGALFAGGCLAYLALAGRWLWRPRADGRPG